MNTWHQLEAIRALKPPPKTSLLNGDSELLVLVLKSQFTPYLLVEKIMGDPSPKMRIATKIQSLPYWTIPKPQIF